LFRVLVKLKYPSKFN